jgi:hypothetical protein
MGHLSLEKLKVIGFSVGLLGLSASCSEYRVNRAAASPASALSAPLSKQAAICIFRPHGLGTSVISPVTDNGAVVGATEGSSYFCYLAEPGLHQIRTADAPRLLLDAEAGQRYYLVHDMNISADSLARITMQNAYELSAWCGEVEVRQAPQNVAVLQRGAVARAEPGSGTASDIRVAARGANAEPSEPEGLPPAPAPAELASKRER